MKSSIEKFKNYLVYEKKSSANTVESYLRDVNQFASYCSSLNILSPTRVDKNILIKFLGYLSVMGKSDELNCEFWHLSVAILNFWFRWA